METGEELESLSDMKSVPRTRQAAPSLSHS